MKMERRRVVSADPPNYESPLHEVKGWITPTDLHFVRSQNKAPEIDPETYRLTVEGDAVERPITLSLAEIQRLPSRSQINWLECAGNNRSEYERVQRKPVDPAQLLWGTGAVSNSEWTGASLSHVLDLAGVKPNARDVLLEGLDEQKVARPMPLDVARRPETLLAYAVNGGDLPPDNGYPLRGIVPGWIGTNSIKWVGRIVVSSEPIKVKWNTTSYAMHGPDWPDDPPLSWQPLKATVALPWEAKLKAGPQVVRGFAWSPHGLIEKVEISVDGGTAQSARLLEPNQRHAWVRWEIDWDATPGEHTLSARATDDRGNRQPDAVPWNSLGYLYNAVVAHPVTVER
jgi:DMSO/TMAO reductase YedYZ molybdopterin-dependent catalytic subunit